MKTLENLILGDWGPTMRGIAQPLGHAVAIPAAVLIVMAQWLAFTWRRPLAGVLALVPVRLNSGAVASSPNLADDGPPARVVSPALDATLDQAIGLARPARPVGPDGPVLAPGARRQRRRSNRPQDPA